MPDNCQRFGGIVFTNRNEALVERNQSRAEYYFLEHIDAWHYYYFLLVCSSVIMFVRTRFLVRVVNCSRGCVPFTMLYKIRTQFAVFRRIFLYMLWIADCMHGKPFSGFALHWQVERRKCSNRQKQSDDILSPYEHKLGCLSLKSSHMAVIVVSLRQIVSLGGVEYFRWSCWCAAQWWVDLSSVTSYVCLLRSESEVAVWNFHSQALIEWNCHSISCSSVWLNKTIYTLLWDAQLHLSIVKKLVCSKT